MTFLYAILVLVTAFNVVSAHHNLHHSSDNASSSAGVATDTATTSLAADAAATSLTADTAATSLTADTAATSLTTDSATISVTFATSTTSQQSSQSTGSNNRDGSSSSNSNSNSLGITLDSSNLQTASDSDGFASVEAGQTPSLTDNANFINFCSGQRLTNGTQVTSGSCNGIIMGQIPSSDNMISTIITNPAPGDNIPSNQDFTVNIQVSNLQAGTFTNPNTTYYSAPQTLKNGQIVGHTHITIQSLGNNIATSTPPDASKFVFFKGVNNAGDGHGGLSAAVTGGLPAGVYRVCTMSSASNHQPVLMPVAQRGAQDDCTKFTVSDGNGNSNGNRGSATSVTSTRGSGTSTANNGRSAATGNADVVTFVREGSLRFAKRTFIA